MRKQYKRTRLPCITCFQSGKPGPDQVAFWEDCEKKEGEPKPIKCWICNGKGYTVKLEQRFLCIGGLSSGEYGTEEEAGKSYFVYNRSGRRYTGPSAVLIHKSVLTPRDN